MMRGKNRRREDKKMIKEEKEEAVWILRDSTLSQVTDLYP